MRAPLRQADGFTLAEVLAVLAILGFVIAGLLSFYLAGVTAWQRGVDRMEYQQSARVSLERMIRDLRFAGSVTIVKPDEIRFRFPNDPKIYTYRKSGEELVHESRNGGTSHTKIALGITGLTFAFDGEGNLHITVTAGKGAARITMGSSVRPRNIPRE